VSNNILQRAQSSDSPGRLVYALLHRAKSYHDILDVAACRLFNRPLLVAYVFDSSASRGCRLLSATFKAWKTLIKWSRLR